MTKISRRKLSIAVLSVLSVALGLAFQQTIASPLPGHEFEITPEKLRFRYEGFDSGLVMTCRHEIENAASQDWKVFCQDATGRHKREYGVHLWLSAYRHATPPELSYELLYWVTDRTQPRVRVYDSTTIWFHLDRISQVSRVQARVGVENDSAGLYLELKI